jgi:hypothetical protein
MKLRLLTCLLSAATLTFGSSLAWAEADCSNAKADIAHLEHEKKSTDERKVKGVLAILPIGLVVNAVSDDGESDPEEEMEINEYNQKIDDRIAEIRQNCNL